MAMVVVTSLSVTNVDGGLIVYTGGPIGSTIGPGIVVNCLMVEAVVVVSSCGAVVVVKGMVVLITIGRVVVVISPSIGNVEGGLIVNIGLIVGLITPVGAIAAKAGVAIRMAIPATMPINPILFIICPCYYRYPTLKRAQPTYHSLSCYPFFGPVSSNRLPYSHYNIF